MSKVVKDCGFGITLETFSKNELRTLFLNKRRNRAIRPAAVKALKEEMNAHLFDHTRRDAAPILIDPNGILSGGQHRVKAGIDSNLEEITLPVARNATEEEIKNQDSGINRTFRDRCVMFEDIPNMANIKGEKTIASGRLIADILDNKKASPSRAAEVCVQYKSDFEKADAIITKTGRMMRYSPVLAAFVYLRSKMDPVQWSNSFAQFDQGINITPNSPMHRLRNLTESAAASRRQDELFLKTVCALKAVHKNKAVSPNLTAFTKHMEDW